VNDTGDGEQPKDDPELVDLVPYRFHPGVRSLLASALADTGTIERALDDYIDAQERHLLGFLSGRRPLALVGVEIIGRDTARVLHLETAEPAGDAVLGAALLRRVIARFGLLRLSVTVDEAALAFYEVLGFVVVRRDQAIGGHRRIECICEASGVADDV